MVSHNTKYQKWKKNKRNKKNFERRLLDEKLPVQAALLFYLFNNKYNKCEIFLGDTLPLIVL